MNIHTTQWTKPYYGVSHFGPFSTQRAWLTLTVRGKFVELTKWFPGCQFSPINEMHNTEAAAKQAGLKWLAEQHGWQGGAK